MYILKTETTFDSAHFLSSYEGKCSNIHGHTWRIIAEVYSEKLAKIGQNRGMIIDFGEFKTALKQVTEKYDHTLIYEKNTLKKTTLDLLLEEGFGLTEIDCRPTAENFAKIIFEDLIKLNLPMKRVTVYETVNNCAIYEVD